jgi:DNA-directed RNA polymerase subunit RPC12/RpoP
MPFYRCPRCGRQVELPEGNYYCKVCGLEARMVKVDVSSNHLEVELHFISEEEALKHGLIPHWRYPPPYVSYPPSPWFISHEPLSIFLKARTLSLSAITAEARRFKVEIPPIISIRKIVVGGRQLAGCYDAGRKSIVISLARIEEYLKMGLEPEDAVWIVTLVILHEFKHYLDDVAYGVGAQEFAREKERYEKEAVDYAIHTLWKYFKELPVPRFRKIAQMYLKGELR